MTETITRTNNSSNFNNSNNTEAGAQRSARLDAAGTAWAKRISDTVENAKLSYKVTGVGIGSVATRITSGKHQFVVDEPAALAGDDAAASPVEYALGAVIACQVVVYRLYAEQLGIRVEGITINAEGDLDVRGLFGLDHSIRPGFSDIRLDVRVSGPEPQERYEELARTVEARCPVQDLFSNSTPVSAVITKV